MRRLKLKSQSQADEFTSICYWPGPEGAPVIHWAHANGFNGLTYKSLLAPLSEYFHVYASDARGHGKSNLSADPEKHIGWDIYRDDLLNTVEFLEARHHAPIFLAGHSMGGCASAMAAAYLPQHLMGVVLVDPVIIPPHVKLLSSLQALLGRKSHGSDLRIMASRRRADWPSVAAMEKAYSGRGAFATWKPEFLKDYLVGGTLKAEAGVKLACAPLWEAANFASQQHDSLTPIRRIEVPMTLLVAEKGSTTRGLAAFRKNPNTRKIDVVDGSTHFLPMEFPERVREEIIELAKQSGALTRNA